MVTRCRQLFGAAACEDYTGKEIFNGEAAGEQPRRFQSRSESWANAAERDMEMALIKHGLLCDGALLHGNALRSTPCCGRAIGQEEAALLGRQPAHRDAPARGRRGARKELADTLADADMPRDHRAASRGLMTHSHHGHTAFRSSEIRCSRLKP
jgi:hypothetical protein